MTNFFEVTFTTSEQQLAEEAVNKLVELIEEKGLVGWEPSESDLEIIQIGVLAGLALTANQIASVVPNAIFRQFGTQLLALPFNEGAPATAKTKWTIIPAEGVRQIEAGTQIEAGGFGFYVETTTEVPAKATSVELQIVALAQGTEYNKIEGIASQVNPVDWVTEVQIVGETTNGSDEESDEAYLIRLAAELELQAPRPVTAKDFAAFVLLVPSTIVPTGTVGRATSIEEYNAKTKESSVLRCVSTFVTDPEGQPVSKPHMEAIEAWLKTKREANFLTPVEEASYTTIYITFKIHVLAGFEAATVLANVKESLLAVINPKVWGNPTASTTGSQQWVNEKPSRVRYNTVIGLIEEVPAVAYVYTGSEGLKTGTAPTPTGTADITLEGPAPLPETTNLTVIGTVE